MNPPHPAGGEPPAWLSSQELGAWTAFAAVLLAMPPAMDAQLKRDAGLNFFEYTILAGISEAPGRSLRLSTVAQLAAGSTSRVSHAVSRLQRQGILERRTQATGEPRSTTVALTDAGLDLLRAIAPAHVRDARRLVLDVLTESQIDQLGIICRQLLAHAAPETAALLKDGR